MEPPSSSLSALTSKSSGNHAFVFHIEHLVEFGGDLTRWIHPNVSSKERSFVLAVATLDDDLGFDSVKTEKTLGAVLQWQNHVSHISPQLATDEATLLRDQTAGTYPTGLEAMARATSFMYE